MIERKLLYYRESKNNPEEHIWNFLIINEEREIKLIKQNIYSQLNPIYEEKTIDQDLIPYSNGLHYQLFTLKTVNYHLDLSKVYLGKTIKDRRLQSRTSKDGWNDLINKVYQGEI